jgi:hypothetical protein
MSGLVEGNRAVIESGDCREPEVKPTVGDEFIKWAEKYWGLEEKYKNDDDGIGESCPYSFVKGAFIKKIDELIKDRLSL